MRIAEVLTGGIVIRTYEQVDIDRLGLAEVVGMVFAPPLLGYFEIGEEVECGWTYKEGVFSPPPQATAETMEKMPQ